MSSSPSDVLSELNDEQALAVAHADGPLLVFAGAGSGKTRVITYRIANLLATHRVPPYRILAVTFTNKAAGELRARLERLAGTEVTRDLWAGTFHSVCARLLRRYHEDAGLGRDFVIYDESDQKAVVSRLLKQKEIDERQMPPRWLLARFHGEKREGRGPDQAGFGHETEVAELFLEYERALERANAVDFEDLILRAMRLAEDEKSAGGQHLRERFRYVLVDEFQDTNLIQYRLVRALTLSHRNLCVVGDDDQSIYRWRGADVRIIRGFKRDFPEAIVVKLVQNYRSTGNIVAAALGVIGPSYEREPKDLWTAQAAGDPVRVRAVADEREEAKFVVRTIKAELARGVDPREIAIFYRVHAQSRVLEETFRAENVSYQIIGGMRFFERAEVKDLIAYLRLVENPKSDADLMRIINVPTRGIGDKTLELVLSTASERGQSAYDALGALVKEQNLTGTAKTKLAQFYDLIEELRADARTLSPSQLAGRVLDRSGYQTRLHETDSAESDARLGNLRELIGSIRQYEEEVSHSGETPSLGGWLERISLVAAVDSMKDVPSVSLMTVHAAKGLEFTTVFLTGMEEETFPYRGLESGRIDDLEEERRLAYVAITRARERLYVTHAGARTIFGKTRYCAPSRFLDDLPETSVRFEGVPVSRSTLSGPTSRGEFSRREPSWQAGVERARAKLGIKPGDRVVDREAFDDVSYHDASDDGSSVTGREFRRATCTPVSLRPGDHIRHKKFGRGIVESVEHDGEITVVARFPGYGTRRVRAAWLELG